MKRSRMFRSLGTGSIVGRVGCALAVLGLAACSSDNEEETSVASHSQAIDYESCTGTWDHRSCFYQNVLSDPACRDDTIMWGPNDNETSATNTSIANWDIPTYACIRRIATEFEQQYPNRVRAIDIGETVDSQPIVAIRIGTDDDFPSTHPRAGQPKPVVLFDAAIHGNEREGARIVLDWMDYVLNPLNEFDGSTPRTGYPGAPAGHTFSTILDERVIWIVPAVNADNLNVNNGRSNENGVNLARNFLWGWSSTQDPTYPFSQPEVIALARFAEMIQPSVYLNVHGWRHGLRALEDAENPDDGYDGYWDSANSVLYSEIQPNLNSRAFLHSTTTGDLIPIGNTGTHWSVARSDANSATSFPHLNAIQYVCRGVPGVCPIDDSLPALAEMSQDTDTSAGTPAHLVTRHMGPRMYSPFAPNDEYAHYVAPNWTTLGVNPGELGQSFGYMNAGLGALSILYEMQRFDTDSDVYGTNAISVPTPVVFPRGSRLPQPSFVWGIHKEEESIQMLIRDSFYPMNKLALAAANPVPKSVDPLSTIAHNDVSLSALRMSQDGCTMDYTATYEKTPSSIFAARNGYFGTRDVSCTATNLGQVASGRFRIDMRIVENGTQVASHSCDSDEAGLAVESSQTCTLDDFSFAPGEQYSVVCEVVPRAGDDMETELDQILRNGDAGCAALYAASGFTSPAELEAARPDCVWDAGNSHWDAVFHTNNRRIVRFDATLSQYAVCDYDPWDDRIDVNGNIPDSGSDFGVDFGTPGNWSSTGATVTPSNEDGKSAVAVDATGFTFINSRVFDTSELGDVTDTVVVDVKLPDPLPNPYWKGDLQLHVTCADDNLHNVWIGQASFAPLTPGVFEPVAIQFGPQHAELMSVLVEGGHSCHLDFSLTVPSEAATYYLGDIRFE